MNLVKRYVTGNFYYKNIYVCSYLFNENNSNRTQYHTCLNSFNIKTKILKCEALKVQSRQSSVYEYIKEKNFNLSLKAKEITGNMWTFIPGRRLKYEILGARWYQTLDEINVKDFFDLFEMIDSFFSRFKIIELHVWMLLYHLPKDTRANEIVRAGLIKAMWQDNENRAKMLSKDNPNFKKNFKDLYGKFLLTELLYDDGFLTSDASLCNAVWCSFFNKRNIDPRLLEAMVSYIRYQMSRLGKLNMEELTQREEKGKIWAPARPHFDEVLRK